VARHVSARHIQCVKPMHFGCVKLVEQHGSTQSTRRVRIAQHDVRDRRDSQLSLLCNLYKVTICKLFTNLLEYTHLFHFTEQIGFVYVRAKTTTCTGKHYSLFLVRHVGTARIDMLVLIGLDTSNVSC